MPDDYPPATDETICETCGERGHYWCRTSRVLFKGRGKPAIYPEDFFEDTADEQEPTLICKSCGRAFHPEGSVVASLDKILCVPCIGDALSRVTS